VEDIQSGISRPLQEMILSSDDEILTQSSPSSFGGGRNEGSYTYPSRSNAYGGSGGSRRSNDDMDYEDDDDEDEDIDEDDYDDQLG
jgi:hypothetical protein